MSIHQSTVRLRPLSSTGTILLALALIGAAVVTVTTGSSASTEPRIGPFEMDRAPDFTLDDLDGESSILSEIVEGPTLLVFWTTTCPACVHLLPEIQKLHALLSDPDDSPEDYSLVTVNLTFAERGGPSAVSGFLSDRNHDFSVLFETTGMVWRSYAGRSIPMLVFVDAERIIQLRYAGFATAEQMLAVLDIIASTKE